MLRSGYIESLKLNVEAASGIRGASPHTWGLLCSAVVVKT